MVERLGYREFSSPVLYKSIQYALRGAYDLDSFDFQCQMQSLYPSEVANALKKPEFFQPLVRELAENFETHPYSLALASASASYDSYSDEEKNKMSLEKDESSMEVQIFHSYWDLCFRSEDFLRRSFQKNDGLLIVNDKLLVKRRGYKVGLCVQSFASEKSTFIKGVWYEPSGETKNKIKHALEEEQGELYLEEGTWVAMRSLKGDGKSNKLLGRAERFIEGIPEPRRRDQLKNKIRHAREKLY